MLLVVEGWQALYYYAEENCAGYLVRESGTPSGDAVVAAAAVVAVAGGSSH
jgi:hypothetical protein